MGSAWNRALMIGMSWDGMGAIAGIGGARVASAIGVAADQGTYLSINLSGDV